MSQEKPGTLWQQLMMTVSADEAERLGEFLFDLGASAVTLKDAADQPIYEPPIDTVELWTQTHVVALFADDVDLSHLSGELQKLYLPKQLPEVQIQRLPDQVWERSWMDGFKPMQFAENFWVVPSWLPIPNPDAINMALDPGIAFGTGTHPTTHLCLQWLAGHPPKDQTAIDYGCGSGILAIAAALLGASSITATDIDPQALKATLENAKRNGCIDKISVHLVSPNAPGNFPAVQLLMANILCGPLVELANHLQQHVLPGGEILLSGILEPQAEEVISAYTPWFDMAEPTILDGWISLWGRRIDSEPC